MSALTIPAHDIKPGDYLVVLNVDALWVSHIEEFYVNIGWADKRLDLQGSRPIRISKVQDVTVIRKAGSQR